MSLKILLADESPTIKKAFEIALKDFGVKIQSVHQGIDVKELCETFKPHICFLDVLIPKLNGYEASAQLKAEPALARIPTVIMWSGFIELDEDKFMTSGADGKIEKPFETPVLRSLIQKLVPSINSNEIAQHIIPDSIPHDEVFGSGPESSVSQTEVVVNEPPLSSELTDSVDDFSIEQLGAPEHTSAAALSGFDDLDDFKIETLDDDSLSTNTPPEPLEGFEDMFGSAENTVPPAVPGAATPDDIFGDAPPPMPETVNTMDAAEELAPLDDDISIVAPTGEEPPSFNEVPKPPQFTAPDEVVVTTNADDDNDVHIIPEESNAGELFTSGEMPQLSKDELKRLILAQSKDIIESVVWDVVPELARELIQKEISKLMGKAEDTNLDGNLR